MGEYKNSYVLKEQRTKKLILAKYKCEACGDVATKTHHKNRDKSDHRIENLFAICNKCHLKVHRNDGKPYAPSQKTMSKTIIISPYEVCLLHDNETNPKV